MLVVKSKTVFVSAILAVFVLFLGCATGPDGVPNKYLSRTRETVSSPFKTYEETVRKCDKEIVVGKTTAQDLKKIGIYEGAPNVGTPNWLSVEKIFIHKENINRKDLPEGVQTFLNAKNKNRKAYELIFSDTGKHHEGNFWKHFFNFLKIERMTGWHYYSLILTVENVVVYVLPHDGKANINIPREEVNPLGPLQNLGGDTAVDGAKRVIW